MSQHELIQYVFVDQISTKGEQTQISGRGVGLAAVQKENFETKWRHKSVFRRSDRYIF